LNLDACIRCFCCQEVCPEGAVLVEDGALLRLGKWLGRWRKEGRGSRLDRVATVSDR